jgi:hypothetical protein
MKKLLSFFALMILWGTHLQVQANVANDSTRAVWTDDVTKIKAIVPMGTVNHIYSSPKGEITDSLKSAHSEDWIIVTIDSLKDGCAKLIDVFLVRSRPNTPVLYNVWVPLNILYTGLNDPINTFKVPVSPSKDSKQLVCTTVPWMNIIDIKGNWLKLKFKTDGNEHVGWKHKFNICVNPFSTWGWRPLV